MQDNQESWTGERLETFIHTQNTTEHLHRYALAMKIARGKDVLDIACGEGYGSALMSSVAKHVTGVDIDKATIENARHKYADVDITFKCGSAAEIPCDDECFDVVVSFETIEHHDLHEEMMREIKRVLRPGGLLIISSPDKHFYSDVTGYKNPFHVKELYSKEFSELLKKHFHHVNLLSQRFTTGSLIIPVNENDPIKSSSTEIFSGDYDKIQTKEMDPVYNIAIASDAVIDFHTNFSFFLGEKIVADEQKLREDYLRGTITEAVATHVKLEYESSDAYKLGSKLLKKYPFLKRFA